MRALIKRRLGLTLGVLANFRGNSRTCLAVEPLWGISYNLYIPYASLYMLALGLSETQLGIVTSVGLLFQTVFSLLSGWITDRLGRRRTSLWFDLLSWTVPTLIWAFAGSFAHFLIAASLNALVRIVHVSWSCLLIEDTPPAERVHVYTWIAVAGILAGFFAPIAGIFVDRAGLVPSVRGLYLFACVAMTSMFFIRNRFTTETAVGLVKMREAKEHGLRETLAEYGAVTSRILKNPYVLAAFALAALSSIQVTLRNTFLSVVLTNGLGLSKASIAVFPAIASAISILLYVFVMPSVGKKDLKAPLSFGLLCSLASNLLLIFAPVGSYAMATLSTVAGAFGVSFVIPIVDTYLSNAIEDAHRAKILAILSTAMFAISSPFGYLGGVLAGMNARLPAVLLAVSFVLSVGVTAMIGRLDRRRSEGTVPDGASGAEGGEPEAV